MASPNVSLRNVLHLPDPSPHNKVLSHRPDDDDNDDSEATDAFLRNELERKAIYRSGGRRERILESSPGVAKLFALESSSTLIYGVLLSTCVVGAQWPLLLISFWVMACPERVCPPSVDCVGLEEPAESQIVSIAPQASVKKRAAKLRKIEVVVSTLVDGTSPVGTFNVCSRSQLRVLLLYNTLHFVSMSIFQIVLSTDATVQDKFYSVQTANINGTTSPLSVGSFPWFEAFGLWDAKKNSLRFVLNLIPAAIIILLCTLTIPLAPKRLIYYFPKKLEAVYRARGADVADSRPNLLQRRVQLRGLLLLFVVSMTSAVTLPSLMTTLICLLTLIFTCSMFLPAPAVSCATPSITLQPLDGEEQPRRYKQPFWDFKPNSNVGVRVRSISLAALHYSSLFFVFAIVAFQNPVFEGFNTDIAGTASSTASVNISSSGVSVNASVSAMASSWYHKVGLYNIRHYYANSPTAPIASNANFSTFNSSVVFSTIQGAVTHASNDIGTRALVQLILLVVVVIICRHVNASMFYLPMLDERDSNKDRKNSTTPGDGAVEWEKSHPNNNDGNNKADSSSTLTTAFTIFKTRVVNVVTNSFSNFAAFLYEYSPLLTPLALMLFCVALPSLTTAAIVIPLTFALCVTTSLTLKSRLCAVLGVFISIYIVALFVVRSLELYQVSSVWVLRVLLGSEKTDSIQSLSTANFSLGIASLVVIILCISHFLFVNLEESASKKAELLECNEVKGINTEGLTQAEISELRRRLWRAVAVIQANKILGKETVQGILHAFENRDTAASEYAASKNFKTGPRSGSGAFSPSIGSQSEKPTKAKMKMAMQQDVWDAVRKHTLPHIPEVRWVLSNTELSFMHRFVLTHCPSPTFDASATSSTNEPSDDAAPLDSAFPKISLDDIILMVMCFKDSGATITSEAALMRERTGALPVILSEAIRLQKRSSLLQKEGEEATRRLDLLRMFLAIPPTDLNLQNTVGLKFFPIDIDARGPVRASPSPPSSPPSKMEPIKSSAFTPQRNASFSFMGNQSLTGTLFTYTCLITNASLSNIPANAETDEEQEINEIQEDKESSSRIVVTAVVSFFRELRLRAVLLLHSLQSFLYYILVVSGMLSNLVFLAVSSYRLRMSFISLILLGACMLSTVAVLCSLSVRKRICAVCCVISACVLEVVLISSVVSGEEMAVQRAGNTPISFYRSNDEANWGLDGFHKSVWEIFFYFVLFFALLLQYRVLLWEVKFVKCAAETSEIYFGSIGQTSGEPLCPGEPKEFLPIQWQEVRGFIEWRVLCGSQFFYKLQLYAVLLSSPPLFIFLNRYENPNYFCAVFLVLFLAIAWTATITVVSMLQRPVLYRLWITALALSTVILVSVSLFNNPFVNDRFLTWLTQTETKDSFIEEYCGKYIYLSSVVVVNETTDEEIARGNYSYANVSSSEKASYCATEIGLRASTSEPVLKDLGPWFAVMMFSTFEIIASLHFYSNMTKPNKRRKKSAKSAADDTAINGASQQSAAVVEIDSGNKDDEDEFDGMQDATELMVIIEQFVIRCLRLIETNIHKAAWLVYFFSAAHVPNVMNLVYVFFLVFDLIGWAPLLYSSLHLVSLYWFSISAFPSYWTTEGMNFVGLRRHLFEAANGARTSTYIVLVGPALTLALNLIYQSTASLAMQGEKDIGNMEAVLAHREKQKLRRGVKKTIHDASHAAGTDQKETEAPPFTFGSFSHTKKDHPAIELLATAKQVFRRALLATTVFVQYVYRELIRTLGFELTILVLLIGMSLNSRRAVTAFFFLSYAFMTFLGRDQLVVRGAFIKMSIIFYQAVVVLTLVLGLGIPSSGSSSLMIWFFGTSERVVLANGAENFRFSWAYYLGAQPDRNLLWSYFFVILFFRLLARELPHAIAHQRETVTVKGYEFVHLQDMLASFERQINVARQYNLELNFLFPTSVKQESPFLVTDLPWECFGSAADEKTAEAHVQVHRDAAAGIRRTVPLWKRLENPSTIVEWIIFLFAIFFVPSWLIFADGNDGSSVIHFALLLWAIILWTQLYLYRLYWYPTFLWWITIHGYSFLLLLFVVTNIPVVARFIEQYPRVFEAFGLAQNGRTMPLSGTRVVSIVACLLQQRLYNSFLYLGVLTTLHNVQRASMSKFSSLMKVLASNEVLENTVAESRDAERNATLRMLNEKMLDPLQGGAILVEGISAHPTGRDEEGKQDNAQGNADDEADGKEGDKKKTKSLFYRFFDYTTDLSRRFVQASAKHTFSGVPPSADDALPLQVAKTIFALIQRRSDTILIFFLALNFALSGSLYDAMPVIMATGYAAVVHPWANRSFYNIILGYLFVGVVLKGFVRFIASQSNFSARSASFVSTFIIRVSPGAQNTFGKDSLSATDLALDFMAMIAVLLHTRNCDYVGAYALSPHDAVYIRNIFDEEAKKEKDQDETASADEEDDNAVHTECESDSEDEKIIIHAQQTRKDEAESFEREVEEYEALLSTTMRRREASFIEEQKQRQRQHQRFIAETEKPALIDLVTRFASDFMGNVSHIEGSGVDLYTITILLETFSLMFTMFAFFLLSGAESGSFLQSVIDNNLPGYLVVVMLLMTLIMVVDRVIYTYSSHQAGDAQKKKFVLHCALILGYHIFYIYWYSAIATSQAGGAALFMFKIAYLCLSGQQIRRGFPLFRRHDPITHSAENGLLYKVYMNIPFLWDLRMMLDWTFSVTTLSFDDFVKVEAIAAVVFSRYGSINDASSPRRGFALPFSSKIIDGFVLFSICFLIIFFPLMYYSTFNPSTGPNFVTQASVQLEVENFGPLYGFSTRVGTSATLIPDALRSALLRVYSYGPDGFFSAEIDTQLISLEACSSALWSISPSGRANMMAVLKKFIDGVTVESLTLNMAVKVQRSRQINTGSGSNEIVFPITLSTGQSAAFLSVVNNSITTPLNATSPSSAFSLVLDNFVEPTIVGGGDGVVRASASIGRAPSTFSASCLMTLFASIDSSGGTNVVSRYWCVSCQGLFYSSNAPPADPSSPDYECVTYGTNCAALNYNDWTSPSSMSKNFISRGSAANSTEPTGPYFLVSSQRIPSGTSFLPINIGIIALYATFILSLGNIVRSILTSNPSSIITDDMHDPTVLAKLIAYIHLSRGGGRSGSGGSDLVLEEKLYFEMIDLIRNPERLLKETGLRKNTFDSKGKRVEIKPFLTW